MNQILPMGYNLPIPALGHAGKICSIKFSVCINWLQSKLYDLLVKTFFLASKQDNTTKVQVVTGGEREVFKRDPPHPKRVTSFMTNWLINKCYTLIFIQDVLLLVKMTIFK